MLGLCRVGCRRSEIMVSSKPIAKALLARMGNEGATSRGGDFGELMEGVRVRAARLARRVGFPVDRRQH